MKEDVLTHYFQSFEQHEYKSKTDYIRFRLEEKYGSL